MLRLRSSILAHILPSPATSPFPSLHRLISAAAPAKSRSPRFAVEDYLVDTCGLTPIFRHALHAVAFLSEEKIAAQVDNLKNTLRWSDAEVLHAVSKLPIILRYNNLQSKSEFLISEVGLEPIFIAHRPPLLTFSLEGRLRPRYYVLKFLKENGLLHHNRDYYNAVIVTEKVFVEKYIYPYKKTAPHLAEDYADACSGQVPTRFRFA